MKNELKLGRELFKGFEYLTSDFDSLFKNGA